MIELGRRVGALERLVNRQMARGGGFWLGSLPDVIIVDPTGTAPNSHLTLAAAVAVATGSSLIVVCPGFTTEVTSSVINSTNSGVVIWFLPQAYAIFTSTDPIITVNTLRSVVVVGPYVVGGLYNDGGGAAVELAGTGSTLFGMNVNIEATAYHGIEALHANARVTLYGGTVRGGGVSHAALSVVGGLAATSKIIGVRFTGTEAITSTSAWSNAPIYFSVLENGVTNVTSDPGTPDGTNVII